jgi:hypothetical protein
VRTVRIAYRDNDRTSVIYCIKAMAERRYSVEAQVVQIEPIRSNDEGNEEHEV